MTRGLVSMFTAINQLIFNKLQMDAVSLFALSVATFTAFALLQIGIPQSILRPGKSLYWITMLSTVCHCVITTANEAGLCVGNLRLRLF